MRPKKTILCVDDNEQILSVRTFLLQTRGYRVIAVPTPREALETIADATPGTYDLLLCDLLMPGMDGWAVLSTLKADPDLRKVPVVLMTIMEDKDVGFALGAADFLPKPINRSRLATLLIKYGQAKEA